MEKYIKYSDLLEELNAERNRYMRLSMNGAEHVLAKFAEELDEIAEGACDPAENRRGYWHAVETYDGTDGEGATEYRCSECSCSVCIMPEEKEKLAYCPHCGADMRSRKDG